MRQSRQFALSTGNSYPVLDGSTNRPGFCYDTALLLPEFNPMAVPMPPSDAAGSSGLVASPLTTVLVFSQAAGGNRQSLPMLFELSGLTDVYIATPQVDPEPESLIRKCLFKQSFSSYP